MAINRLLYASQRRRGWPRGTSRRKGVIMAQVAVNEAVDQLSGELIEAWNAGDARAYGARFCPDVTFTNSDGTVDLGRDEVVRHAEEAFHGVLAGTKLSLAVRKLRLVRPDVALPTSTFASPAYRSHRQGPVTG